jgi:lysophospholipase L1-like esterase
MKEIQAKIDEENRKIKALQDSITWRVIIPRPTAMWIGGKRVI